MAEHRSWPAGVQRALDAATVRIRSHTGEVIGSGFLIAAGHVVTCAHVVTRALGHKTREAPAAADTVSLDFPLIAPGVVVGARVAVWHPIEDDDTGDIAILALVNDPPAGALPTYLVAAEDFWSHPFRTFGFPRRYDHGVWASGVLRARQATGWVQMETSPSGYAIEAGFSGAAVWDDELAGVVGMTVAADLRNDRGAAYLIPTEELIRAWPPLADRTVPPCPYRGLYPFRERDANVFYGRQDLTDRLVTETKRRPLVALVGPSGSGKSSVVFAGLLPKLARQEEWLCLSMRPAHASTPLTALAAAFLPVLDPDQAETKRLAALGQLTTLLRDGHLPDVINRVLARAGKTELLLVVDQCEELFAREENDASEFLDILLPTLNSPPSLTVVLTLRADFLGQALQNPALAAALQGAVTTIGQMSSDQLRAVIEGPLPRGVTYQAGLIERILGDVGEEPGSLPLLEFALTLLWERQDRGTLTHSAYEQLGEVSGALASYAERVYLDQLLPEDQEEARRLLIQLIRPSEVGQPVRRIAQRPELGEPRWQLAQRLAATRLLVTDRDPTGVESVELVHEALISRWSRLSGWFDADLAFRTWQEQLRGALAQWEAVRRDDGALFRGTPLAEAERWLTERPEDLGTPERQFIHASRALRTRSLRRLRAVVVILALLVLAASSLGGVAALQRNKANEQSKQAQSVALATRANSLEYYQPDVAMLLAASAYNTAPTIEAINALTSITSRWQHTERIVATDMKDISQIFFSPTDPTMVALADINGIEAWNLKKKNTPRRRHPAYGVRSLTFSPDGHIIAYTESTEQGSRVVLWSYLQDRVIQKISLNLAPEKPLGNLIFSSDGELLGACVGNRIQVWSPNTGHLRYSIPLAHDDTACAFGFRNENRELAYVDGDDIVTRDIATGRTLTSKRPGPPKRSQSSTKDQSFFGKNSSFIVAPGGRFAIYQGTIHESDNVSSASFAWWDFDRKQEQEIDFGGFNLNASFTPDGRHVAISADEGVAVFDVAKRTPIAIYPETFNAGSGAFSSDGHTIAVVEAGRSNAISLIDSNLYHGIPAREYLVAIQPDNKNLTTISFDGKVTIYSIENWNLRRIVTRSSTNDQSIERTAESLSPNGLYYAFKDARTRKIHLLDASSSVAPKVPLEGNCSDESKLSFDPRSDFLACANKSEVVIWSTKNNTKNPIIKFPPGYTIRQVALSPEGRYIAATGNDGETRLRDTRDNTDTILSFDDNAQSASFSLDGKWLSIGSRSEIKLWNLSAKKFDSRRIPAGGLAMKFSPDGSLLATREDEDGKVSVWKLNARDPLLERTASAEYDFAFTSDGHLLTSGNSGVFVEPLNASWALGRICEIVNNRNLNPAERGKYLPPGFDYKPACPSLR